MLRTCTRAQMKTSDQITRVTGMQLHSRSLVEEKLWLPVGVEVKRREGKNNVFTCEECNMHACMHKLCIYTSRLFTFQQSMFLTTE